MPENCAAIVIAAKHHELIKVKDARGTTNTIGALRCKFQFRTDDWLHSAKTAMFCNGNAVLHPEVINDAIAVPLDADDECPVPYEVLTDTLPYSVGVWGVTPKGLRVVSNWLVFNAQVGCYTEGNAPEDPEQTIYEEILLIANEAVTAVKDVTQRADSGEFEGKSAYEVAVDDGFEGTKSEWLASLVGTPGQDGYTPVKGIDYVDGKDGYTPIKGVDYVDGKDGIDGKDGYTPVKGKDYFDGKDGYTPVKGVDYFDGVDGKDGYTPVKGKDYFDGAPGKDGYTPVKGVDYVDGKDGKDGKDGADGVSATHSWNGTTLTITSASGTSSVDLKGEKGNPGDAGYTPQKTIDYWTEDDKKEIEDYIDDAIADIELPEGNAGPSNILDSDSNGGVHQIADNVADGFDFTGKNENATSYDSSLTGTIPYGATGNFASAFGGKSAAIGKRSHAEGTTTIAKGAYSHAEGDNSVTIGADSHAEGYKTTAVAEGSHTEGARTITEGKYSHAEGIDTQTTNFAAHAEGELTHAYGRASHAEGQNTTANSNASHAEGADTSTWGFASHAEGAGSQSKGESAHAEGNRTYAEGSFSHTEGNNTYAGINPSGQFFGESAHAEGENTNAYGYASHTEGIGTDAYGEAQHVQGRYNINDPEGRYAHIVGNGTSNGEGESSNAHTLDWQGNAWFAGNVYVGGNSQDEGKRLVTEEDVDNTVISLVPDKVREVLSPHSGLRLGDWRYTSSIGLQFDYQTIDFSGNRMYVTTSGPTVGYEIAVAGDSPISLIFNNAEGSLYLKNNNGLTKIGDSQASSITMTDDGEGNVFIGMTPMSEGGNN